MEGGNAKRGIVMKGKKRNVCPICGRSTPGARNMDHVFPRALYKWTEAYVTRERYAYVRSVIEDPGNLIEVHRECNRGKQDRLPVLGSMTLGDIRKKELTAMEADISEEIGRYAEGKAWVLKKQDGKCYRCGDEAGKGAVLRRLDPEKPRIWENACVLCRKCNIYRPAEEWKEYLEEIRA